MSNKKILIGLASVAAAGCAFLGYKKYLEGRDEMHFTEDDLFGDCGKESGCADGCCCSKVYEEPTDNIADVEDEVCDEILEEINNEVFEEETIDAEKKTIETEEVNINLEEENIKTEE